MFTSYENFKQADRRIRKAQDKISQIYLNHVYKSVDFWMGAGSRNIQIINDILDTASAGRLQRNRIVDWLAPIIGHETKKLTGGLYGFGAKLEDFDYSLVDAGAHFKQFPDWYSFKPEQAPETFDAKEAIQKELKRIKNLAKKLMENGYNVAGVTLDTFADELDLQPILQKEDGNIEETETEETEA